MTYRSLSFTWNHNPDMERCPNCGARYRTGETCRRCGMELQQLLSIEITVRQLTRQAFSQLANGKVADAAETLSKILDLRYDPFIAIVFDFCNSLLQKPLAVEQGATANSSLSNRY